MKKANNRRKYVPLPDDIFLGKFHVDDLTLTHWPEVKYEPVVLYDELERYVIRLDPQAQLTNAEKVRYIKFIKGLFNFNVRTIIPPHEKLKFVTGCIAYDRVYLVCGDTSVYCIDISSVMDHIRLISGIRGGYAVKTAEWLNGRMGYIIQMQADAGKWNTGG